MTTLSNDNSNPIVATGKSGRMIAVHRILPVVDHSSAGMRSSAESIRAAIIKHLGTSPDEALLLMAPGLEIENTNLEMFSKLACEAEAGTVFTALSNADPDLNPFAGVTTEGVTDLDYCALVALLGTGELFPLHRMPSHLLFIPVSTLEQFAAIVSESGVNSEDLLEQNTRVLLHDRIFVRDESAPIAAAASLSAHEDFRPVSWGQLVRRIDEWFDDKASLGESAGITEACNRAWLEGKSADLHITHSWGGGVARWVESFIESSSGRPQFRLQSEGPRSGDGAGQRLSLYPANLPDNPVASWWLEPVITSTATDHPQYREILEYIVERYNVSRVIVSSLVGHSLDALRIELPMIEVLHDFYPAWPLLDIHPQEYLEEKGANLSAAMEKHELLPDFRGRSAKSWQAVARKWREIIQDRNIGLVAPSRSVANLMPRLYPEFADLSANVIPHGITENWRDVNWEARPRKDGRMRLLIPGRLQKGKGKSLLLGALPELRKYARITLLGCGKDGEDFFGMTDVDVVLNYKREELPDILARIAPDAAALISTVPETFSYMLSELRELRLPVIATRVGSFAERIEDGVDGWLIDPDSTALVEKAAWLVENPDQLSLVHDNLSGISTRSATEMVADYDALVSPSDSVPDKFAVELPATGQAGALASLSVVKRRTTAQLALQLETSKSEVKERTRWARERDRVLKKEREENASWVAELERVLKHEQEAHAHTQESLNALQGQYDAVLGSSSWAVTKPLRVARRLISNFMRARAWNPLRWPLLLSQFTRTVSTLGWRGAIMRFQNAQILETPRGLEIADFEAVGNPDPPARMTRATQPLVSIVIPVHNNWTYTAACLRSIEEAECRAGFEVIVIDDASSDETAERLAGIRDLDAATNQENLGFIGSCNRGAARANGDFIVFLNNDTQVLDGWLDHLLQTFMQFPDTGIAGARLIYPDGTLQECGGMIFRDGSGWNYGRGDDPDRPEYQFVREVDYCSGACIMLRQEVFRELEGFDRHFAPAYYEDTDLAFRVREMGLKVRVQPAATVVHHEGISSGTDIQSGTKRFQAINQEKFLERWKQQLAAYPLPVRNPADKNEIRQACDHRLNGRVLIIDAYTPEPDQDSGSLRLRYLMDCLFDLGYGVSFIPDNRSHARRYTADLQQAGVEAWYHPWLDSLHDWFSRNGEQFDFVMVCRHYVAVNYVNLIRRHCPNARFIFDTIDLHYLREQRLAELEDSLPLKRSAEQTRRSELAVIAEADATLVVSPTEVELLQKDAPGEIVHVVSNIHRVVGSQNPFNAREDIFFVGGFQHPPNVDAAIWFCNSVWPLIQEKLPQLKFHLIGSKATDQIRALHGNGVVFHGFVPRLEPFLDGCRLSVAPLRYGAGVKGKVNLSMSRGQPVVATPAAVEGLFAHDGEDVLVASEPQEFADAVVRLYQDARLWNRISANCVRNVEEYFSLDTARRNLDAVLTSLKK